MQTLEVCKMARFDQRSGQIYMTDLGRIASHFYVRHDSISTINECFGPRMSVVDILYMMAKCAEFESLKVRDEEVQDLEELLRDCCPLDIKDALTTKEGKVQVLLQVSVLHGPTLTHLLLFAFFAATSNLWSVRCAHLQVWLREVHHVAGHTA
jgi:activating signal cointegrator complex subunit 3